MKLRRSFLFLISGPKFIANCLEEPRRQELQRNIKQFQHKWVDSINFLKFPSKNFQLDFWSPTNPVSRKFLSNFSKTTKTPRPTDKLFLFYKNRGNPNINHRSVFQFCWLVKSGEFWFMFLGVAGNKNWREIRTFQVAQKLPHFEPNWRVFDVLISWLPVLQKPTNPQRKQAFYSRFLQNRKMIFGAFENWQKNGGIQDSFWGGKGQCSEGQPRFSRLFKAALLHPPQIPVSVIIKKIIENIKKNSAALFLPNPWHHKLR